MILDTGDLIDIIDNDPRVERIERLCLTRLRDAANIDVTENPSQSKELHPA